MKDKDSKPLIKSARKTVRMAIQLRIVTELKLISKEFGQGSEELIHEIEKGAKKLAKKIAGELKITAPVDKAAPKEKVVKTVAKPKPATDIKKADAAVKKVAAKAVPAKPEKKAEPVKGRTKLPAKKG
ncbi:MAG: hypothetical protein ACHQHN_04790 [Sphingobacteriales bacterium]